MSSMLERTHPRAAECPICGFRNDAPSEILRDDWVPDLCGHCDAPIIVKGAATGVRPREDYDVVCKVDLDALIAGMSVGQLNAIKALPASRHLAKSPGEIGVGSSLRYLRDLWRDKRGTHAPIILALSERRESDGKRAWHLSELGMALREHAEGLPSTRIRAHQVVGYRSGSDRNEETATVHTYAMMADDHLIPMCGFGWNRSNGSRFSIFRGAPGTEGNCKLCRRRVADGQPPVMHGYAHPTRWL